MHLKHKTVKDIFDETKKNSDYQPCTKKRTRRKTNKSILGSKKLKDIPDKHCARSNRENEKKKRFFTNEYVLRVLSDSEDYYYYIPPDMLPNIVKLVKFSNKLKINIEFEILPLYKIFFKCDMEKLNEAGELAHTSKMNKQCKEHITDLILESLEQEQVTHLNEVF